MLVSEVAVAVAVVAKLIKVKTVNPLVVEEVEVRDFLAETKEIQVVQVVIQLLQMIMRLLVMRVKQGKVELQMKMLVKRLVDLVVKVVHLVRQQIKVIIHHKLVELVVQMGLQLGV